MAVEMPGFRPDLPHALSRLPPSAEIESRAVLRACIESRAALAAMDQAARRIPNPTMLINTLPLLEAADSSRIENIVTTTDELFRYANTGVQSNDPATREALRYRTALHEGFQSLSTRPVSTATAITVCRTIKGADMAIRRIPGTQIARQDTGEPVYTPPVGEEVLRDLLSNWERFLHRATHVDPLIRMAIGHYQFEAIHPFTDGNGRTGRILNLLFLVNAGILHLPVLYLSRYIIEHKLDYYQLLNQVTRTNDWEPWILFMLDAVHDTADWTLAKINAIETLQGATARYVRSTLPRVYRHELVELLFNQPYCRIQQVVQTGIAKRQTAARWLSELVAAGVLEEQRLNGRERLFINTRLMTLLTTKGDSFEPFDR